MSLLLTEEDVRSLLPMAKAVELVERVFQLEGEGQAINQPRARLRYPHGLLNYMAAAVEPDHAAGLKTYAVSPHGARFVVLLFDTDSGDLAAIIAADWLGRIRTGAASGVATRYLARPDARVAGIIGTGSQAETQIEALVEARPIELVKIYGRRRERREALARSLDSRLACDVRAATSPQETVEGSDIVTTITTSRAPVVDGRWLAPGTHVNAAGSNRLANREIDVETVRRSAVVAADSVEQARLEAGDLAAAIETGQMTWDRVVPLSAIVSGHARGRTNAEQLTLFESLGVAIEDIAVAHWLWQEAKRRQRGTEVDFGAARD